MTNKIRLPYGINNCHDLYEKLKFEGKRLEIDWNIFDSFNFFVTAWHLHEDWINKDPSNRPKWAQRKKELPQTPKEMMLIVWATRDITNSSKHFHINNDKKKVVDSIYSPEISTYESLITGKPKIGVKIENSYYSMLDLQKIILSYFEWIFDDSIPVDDFPPFITNYIQTLVSK